MPKISELNEILSLYANDYFAVAHDLNGLPSTKKITVTNLSSTLTNFSPYANTTQAGVIKVGDNLSINSAGFLSSTASSGNLGYTGSQGNQGDTGYTGSQGPVGYTGSLGLSGGLLNQIIVSDANGQPHWQYSTDTSAVVIINYTTSYTATSNDSYIFCDPNDVGADITITLTGNAVEGKQYNIKNLNGAGVYKVTVTSDNPSHRYIENPVTGQLVASYDIAHTGDMESWIHDGLVYRHTGSQTGSPIFITGANTYHQVVVKNIDSGNNASGDLVVYNDQGNYDLGTGPFIDMGIDSSTYSNLEFAIFGPNDAYLYTGNANLLIGTSSENTDIRFFTGNTNYENLKLLISDSLTPGIITNTSIYIQYGGNSNYIPTLAGNVALVVSSQNYVDANNSVSQGLFTYPNTSQIWITGVANGNQSYSYSATLTAQNTTFGTFETNARFIADQGIVTANIISGDIIPANNNSYTLGNTSFQWKELHVSSDALYVDNIPLTVGNGNQLRINEILLNQPNFDYKINDLARNVINAGNAGSEEGQNDFNFDGGTSVESIENYTLDAGISDLSNTTAPLLFNNKGTVNNAILLDGSSLNDVMNDIDQKISNRVYLITQKIADTYFSGGSAAASYDINDVELEGGSAQTESSLAIDAGLSNSIFVFNNGTLGYTGSVGNNGSIGYTGSVGSVDTTQNYTFTGNAVFTANVTMNTLNVGIGGTSILRIGASEEGFTTYNSSVNGLYDFNCANGNIFNVTPAASFTPRFNNFVCDNNYATAITMVINQGGTAYVPTSNVNFGVGTANVAVKWQGGTVPTGNSNKKDIVTYSILNVSGTYTVLGQLVTFG